MASKGRKATKPQRKKPAKREGPVSLSPLSFEDAVRGLAQVRPKKKAKKKKK